MEISKEFTGETDGMALDYKVRSGRLADAAVDDRLKTMLDRFAVENEEAEFRQQIITGIRQLVFKANEAVDLLEVIARRKPWYVRLMDKARKLWRAVRNR